MKNAELFKHNHTVTGETTTLGTSGLQEPFGLWWERKISIIMETAGK
jgi:hypothetical protein